MLPARRDEVHQVLKSVAEMHTGHVEKILLRIAQTDGDVLEGFLVSTAPDHLQIRLASGEKRIIPDEAIAAIYLGQRSGIREFVPVAGIILGATGVLVALSQYPSLVPYFGRIAGGIAIGGLVGLRVLMRRTRLGGWLASWKALLRP